jgi:two-component system, NarL family, nitrate/nitrite response regulator NarL
MDGNKIRVLIADDNDLFRAGLISLLAECQTITVVGQARDGWQAIEKTRILRPDVILMDVAMPRMDGVTATEQIKGEHPEVNIAMLSGSEEEHDLFAAVRSGARSYIAKSISLEDLEDAIKTIARGGTVVSPQLGYKLLEEFAHLAVANDKRSGPKITDQLSARQREIVELAATGASNKEIAQRLFIAESTVKVHLRNILDKLELRNRQQIAAVAVQEGLVEDVLAETAAAAL